MEYTDNLLAAADLIAVLAHKGQKDKAGVDYINHPRTVASFVSSNKEKILAMLHDIVEDTELTIDDLYPIFGSEVCDALRLLTHNDKTPYFDYIRSIKTNSLATTVKLADLRHNSDISRIPNPGPKDYDQINKYEKARHILLEQSGKDVEKIITERTNMNQNEMDIKFSIKMQILDKENLALEDGAAYIIINDSRMFPAQYHRDVDGFITATGSFIHTNIVKYYQEIAKIQVDI